MGNSLKADRNPVATVSTFLSYVILYMSHQYISTSLEIYKTSVRLPPSSVTCLKFWEPLTPTAHRVCPGLYRDCFSFTSTFTPCARNLVNILNSRNDREVWSNKYSFLAVVFQRRLRVCKVCVLHITIFFCTTLRKILSLDFFFARWISVSAVWFRDHAEHYMQWF